MRLLVVTQRVDAADDVLGFFHGWLTKLAPLVDRLDVITLYVGAVRLPDNVRVYSLGKELGSPKALWLVRFYRRLLQLLPGADGVFCHMCPEYVLGVAPLNVFFRKPVLFWYAHAAVSGWAKRASERATKVLSPSTDSFDIPTSQLLPTGHGIDTERFSPGERAGGPRQSPFRIVSVNRISHVKDVDTLVEAVRVLAREHRFTDFRVRVIGGPARPEDERYFAALKEKARRYEVDDFIEWVGAVPNKDLPPYYHEADAFVRMQHGGGYGKNELEALACGLPAIVCTPVYEPVYGRFASSLIWREKDAADFAEKILATARWSDSDRREFAALARSYVMNNHNLETLAERIVEELTSLTRKGSG